MRFVLRSLIVLFWLNLILSNTATSTVNFWPLPFEIETPLFVVIMITALLVILSAALISLGEKKKQ